MEVPARIIEKSELEAFVAEAEKSATKAAENTVSQKPTVIETPKVAVQEKGRRSYHLQAFLDEEPLGEDAFELTTNSRLSCTRGKNGVTRVLPSLDLDASMTLGFLEQTTSAEGALKGSKFTWVRGDLIGRGSLGKVFKALDQSSGRIMAVKEVIISATDQEDQKFRMALEHEIDIVQGLSHRHIVSYLGHEYLDDCLFLYMEYMTGGCLSSLLGQFGAFDESLILDYTKQILLGLEYLHSREPPVVHRDVKGANILVGLDGCVKLADFGCSKRSADTVTTTMKGSIPWMAPEVIVHTRAGRSSDIWSFGCVIIEMATAKVPWGQFDNIMQAMVKIGMSKDSPPIPESLSATLKDLISQCVQRDPQARPNAAKLLQHELLMDLLPSCPQSP